MRFLTAALLLALGVFAVLTVTVFVEDVWRHVTDAAIYILCAESLLAGEGYSYLGLPFIVRPPGLSVLLMPLVAPYDFAAMNLLVQVSAALSFGAVLLVMQRLHGLLIGTLATLLYATATLTVETFNSVLAEFPFMALFFTAMWLLMPDREGRPPGHLKALLGALLLGVSAYFRTVAVLALPGLVLLDLLRGGPTRWRGALLAGLVALMLAPWALWTSRAAEDLPRPSAHLLMFNYTTAMFHEKATDPDSPWVTPEGWIQRVVTNAGDMALSLSHSLAGTRPLRGANQNETSTVPFYIGALAVLPMLYTWLRRRSLLDWYMACTVAVLLLYFTFADRLLLPILPLVFSSLLYTAEHLGRALGRRLDQAHLDRDLVIVVGAVLLAVSLTHLEDALELDLGRRVTTNGDLLAATWIRKNTPPNVVVMYEKGPVFTVLTGRKTYSWRNLPGPWPEGCPPIDVAVFGPRPPREQSDAIEWAVREAAVRAEAVPARWYNQTSQMRFYLLNEEHLEQAQERAQRRNRRR